jgi:hypothetical protein
VHAVQNIFRHLTRCINFCRGRLQQRDQRTGPREAIRSGGRQTGYRSGRYDVAHTLLSLPIAAANCMAFPEPPDETDLD